MENRDQPSNEQGLSAYLSMDEARYLPIQARTDELNQLEAIVDDWGELLDETIVRRHILMRRVAIVAIGTRPPESYKPEPANWPEGNRPRDLMGRSAEGWHRFLTGDNLDTPASQYGRKASDCAWWAVAALYVHERSGMEPEEVDVVADELMGLAVNGHEDIRTTVVENLEVIPLEVIQQLNKIGGDE